MLKDSLYNIISLNHQDGSVHATLQLNADSDIFKGHFPTQPVLPGACMLQMVKEVLELALGKTFRLQKADNLKFIQLIDPQINSTVHLNLNYVLNEHKNVSTTGTLASAEAVCFKFQGSFIAL